MRELRPPPVEVRARGHDVHRLGVLDLSSTARDRPAHRGERVAYLDRLKVLLVAAIIAGHGLLSYSSLEGTWPYQEVMEAGLSDAGDAALATLALPSVLFAMGVFFLIAGLLTPTSLERKGARRFARDRLVRLGVPLAAWAILIWPASMAAMNWIAEGTGSYRHELLYADPVLDLGPMWFVAVLLLYSLAYAGWSSGRVAVPRSTVSAPLRGRTLVLLSVAISVATCLVRLVFPLGSGQIGQSHLWQWPQCAGLFGLGIAAARRGWLQPVPERIRRGCGMALLLGILACLSLAGAVTAAGLEPDVFFDLRLHWAPLALAAIEGPLAVGATVWLLGVAQRRLDGPPGRGARALARSAYAAFIVQAPVLIGLALALRPADVPVDVKAIVVAVGGVATSFALAWLAVSRTPLRRVL